ncbi:hypothetical protein [Brevirhabdus pacifica]|nr:hypothetical protein [Brevirhabdus pacifica]
MRGTLAMMRRTAAELATGGMTTKLVLPASQILYLTVDAPGPSDEEREAQVRAALDGRTPYDVSELVFDHSPTAGDKGRRLVAVVARETLDEAEAFAVEHRFNPVSFVARPDGDEFAGEPFFGMTAHARTLLNGDTVERDAEPVRIKGSVPQGGDAEVETSGAEKATAEDNQGRAAGDAGAKTDPAAAPADGQSEEMSGPAPAFSTRRADREARPAGGTVTIERASRFSMGAIPPASAAMSGAADASTDPAAVELSETGDGKPGARRAPVVAPLPDLPGDGQATGQPTSQPTGRRGAQPALPGDVAARSMAGRDAPPVGGAVGGADRHAEHRAGFSFPAEGGPVDGAPAGHPRGMSRRTGILLTLLLLVALALAAIATTLIKRNELASVFTSADFELADATFLPPLGYDEPPLTAFRPTPRPEQPARLAQDAPADDLIGPRAPAPVVTAVMTSTGPIARPETMMPEVPAIDGPAGAVQDLVAEADTIRLSLPPLPPLVSDAAPAPSGQASTTAPAALAAAPQRLAPQAADPLAPLADESVGRAAFSAPDLAEIQPQDAAAAGELLALVTPETSIRPDRRPTSDPGARTSPETTPDEVREERPALADDAAPLLPDGPDPALHYAATGIWTGAPEMIVVPPSQGLDALYIASIDPAVTQQDAIALPPALAGDDLRLPNQAVPADASARFELDARGLVTPAPSGTLSPDGVTVYAGRPDPMPAERPRREAAAQDATDDDKAEATANAPAVAAVRPTARPDDLSDRTERQQLAGLTRKELSQVRPKLRPEEAALTAPGANTKAEIEKAVADANREVVPDTSAEPVVNASKLAVRSSEKPKLRPANFASVMRKARATRMKSVASPDPKADPRLPEKTSVSRAATERNAVNLSKISLIGVYGTSSSRRALVRLPSGKFKKVEVGDRMDGGRVIAIGDESLRYTKSGRSVVLAMPRS